MKWLGRARLYATLRGVRPTLESSPALRLMTLCAMYLAQGMPFGFVAGTLAAYLATQGYGLADVTIKFIAEHGDCVLGDKKDAGFSVRVATSMDVDSKKGGRLINSHGVTDRAAWGKRAEWVDYHGPVNDKTVGVAILNHPSSFRHPTPWHVRTYGLFTANPFGLKSLGQGKDGAYTLKKGKSLTLRHRVIFHLGDSLCAGDGANAGEAVGGAGA